MTGEKQNRRNFRAQLDRLDYAANDRLRELQNHLWNVQRMLEAIEPASAPGGVGARMDSSLLELASALARRQRRGCDVVLATQEALVDIVRVYRTADGRR